MANPVLSAMVDSYPDTINGISDQVSQIEQKVESTQQEKDALIQTMTEIHQEVIDELTPQCDYLYKGPNFYSGSGEGTIASNVTDWRGFNEVIDPEDETEYYNLGGTPQLETYYNGDGIEPASSWTPYEEVTNSMTKTVTDSKSPEFLFIVDYIHKPVIEMDGFYGLNDKIASLNNAKANLLKDKQKYTDALSTLGGYV